MTGRPPLWAPWRMSYVAGERPDGCIFCEPESPRSDRERLIVWRGPHVFVLLNRYPYAGGHLLVAPYVHEGRIEALEPEVQADLIGELGEASRILQEHFDCDGLNVGANLGAAAGAGFGDHLHFHVVPRWAGDVNFMTVVGETRVIPLHIETLYAELSEKFEERSS